MTMRSILSDPKLFNYVLVFLYTANASRGDNDTFAKLITTGKIQKWCRFR
jgi:hypothetical protein